MKDNWSTKIKLTQDGFQKWTLVFKDKLFYGKSKIECLKQLEQWVRNEHSKSA